MQVNIITLVMSAQTSLKLVFRLLPLFQNQLRLLQMTTMWPVKASSLLSRLFVYLVSFGVVTCLTTCTVGLLTKAALTDDLVDRSEAIDIFTLTCNYIVLYILNGVPIRT